MLFCRGRPENCTQIASALSLCAFVYFVFAYEFRPSHIMAYTLLLLEYKSAQQIAHHTVEKLLYPNRWALGGAVNCTPEYRYELNCIGLAVHK